MDDIINEAQNVLSNGGNIIKTRDDRELILVDKDGKIQNAAKCGWLPENEENINNSVFRTRIEPWLTSLFQSEHLSLLCGSGITNAVSFLAGSSGGTTMAASSFTIYKNEIEEAAKKSAKASGRDNGNIEDQIRTANDLLRGLRILNKNTEADSLEKELNDIISVFAKSILESEKAIATAAGDKRENAYSVLVNFLLSFASRTGNRERLNIFTTNYDRLIEVGAELAGIHLMDRFVGTMMPIFRSSRLNLDIHYNPPGIRGEPRYLEGVARLTKLHGSVDWLQNEHEIRRIGLPFGADDITPYLNAPGLKETDPLKLMILEKARVFAPFGHAGLPPFGMIRLTPPGKIKMTPVDDTAGEFFCSFENPCPGTAGFNIKNYKYDCKIKKHPEMLRSWNGNKRDGQYVSHFPQHSAQVCPAVHFKRQADRATA